MPALALHALAVDPAARCCSILSTYFADLEDVGTPHSNFVSTMARLQSAGAPRSGEESWQVVPCSRSAPASSGGLDDALFDRADRARPIRRALAAVSPENARVLRAAFDLARHPGGDAFGDLAAVALLTRAARQGWMASGTNRPLGEWLVRLSWKVTRGTASGADLATAHAIAEEAKSLRDAAVQEFLSALRAYRRFFHERRAAARLQPLHRADDE